MIFGLFKSDQLLMSLNYSHLISANSVFVKEIQIRNLRDPGPVIYSFSERPTLRDAVDYSETHDDVVESMFHKEWRFWLNEGSTIRVTYEMKGFGQDYLVLAFIRGTEGLDDWKRAPETPAKALNWYRIHGSGVKDFRVDRDDEYFIAFGNLNRGDMEITTEFSIHSTLYSVKGADKRTAFTSDVETITVPITLFHADYLLLTTPTEPQEGADIWEVAVIYSTRWFTYCIIWGIVVFALVMFCGMEFGGHFWRRSREELPLLAPRDDPTMPGHATNDLPGVAVSTPPGESAPYGESARDDQQLCTICLDAPKDCFFDPCGHRCTCYSCGRRIQGGNTATCPICRQPIKAVRKIFDS